MDHFEHLESIGYGALDRCRAGVGDSPGLLHLSGGERPVACLVFAGAPEQEELVLPLRSGKTVVGRGAAADYVVERRRLLSVVEGAQWKVMWSASVATVEDLGSTNGSLLLRRQCRGAVDLALGVLAERRADLEAGSVEFLGWDGRVVHADRRDLRDGDVLVNFFGHLLYCTT